MRNGSLVLPISEEHGDKWDDYVDDALKTILHSMRLISLSSVPISGVDKEEKVFIESGNKVNIVHASAVVAFGIDEAIPESLGMTRPPKKTFFHD